MGSRGRKPAAELAVKPEIHGGLATLPRPPASLTPEQSEVWRAVVPSLPKLTCGLYPLLEAYCQHVVSLRHVNQLIQQDEATPIPAEGEDEDEAETVGFDDELYDRHLKMQERESRILASLAMRLGITEGSASYQEKKKRAKGKAAPGWQVQV